MTEFPLEPIAVVDYISTLKVTAMSHSTSIHHNTKYNVLNRRDIYHTFWEIYDSKTF